MYNGIMDGDEPREAKKERRKGGIVMTAKKQEATKSTPKVSVPENTKKRTIRPKDLAEMLKKHEALRSRLSLTSNDDLQKKIRAQLRANFSEAHEHGTAWQWQEGDKQLAEIIDYLTKLWTPKQKATGTDGKSSKAKATSTKATVKEVK